MDIRVRKNQRVAKNLEAMKQEIEELFEDNGDSLYIMIQAAYQARYGAIPSAGAICNWLKKQGLAGSKKSYGQRETQGSYYTVRGTTTYIMIQVEQGRWEMEHVLICKALGRWYEGCVIHHIDGDGTNNIPSNLLVMDRGEHTRLHALQRWADPEYRERMTRKIRSAAAKRKLAKRIAEINNGTQAA